MDWLWHIKTKLHLTDKKKYYYFLITSEKFTLKVLRRYDAIKIGNEISVNFPEMLIIGSYVKIMFKNRDLPYYFLSSRDQKIKNITQFEQKRLFFSFGVSESPHCSGLVRVSKKIPLQNGLISTGYCYHSYCPKVVTTRIVEREKHAYF